MNWGERYYDHYERTLHVPCSRLEFAPHSEGPTIQVLGFDEVFPGLHVFTTLGLTHYVQELSVVAELIMVADSALDAVPYLLASACFFMVDQRMKVGRGMAVCGLENVDRSFVGTFGKSAVYLSEVYDLPPEFSRVEGDGATGSVLLASFITRAEFEYFKRHGSEQFEYLMEQAAVDPFQLKRESCV